MSIVYVAKNACCMDFFLTTSQEEGLKSFRPITQTLRHEVAHFMKNPVDLNCFNSGLYLGATTKRT
jgi:hypothetical protein